MGKTTTAVRERPIILSGESVRAVLAGRKTQTRRVVKPQPTTTPNGCHEWKREDGHRIPGGPRSAFGGRYVSVTDLIGDYCPYGRPGDRLWVRETWQTHCDADGTPPAELPPGSAVQYPAAYNHWASRRRSAMHMPRWASRLTLELTAVRVERVQDISETDAEAEVVGEVQDSSRVRVVGQSSRRPTGIEAFAWRWGSLNAARGFPWADNPWVWVLTFNVVPQAEAKS